jgi:glycogen operon protein
MLSQGVPMIYMGDECGRTQRGNNNAYCHDAPWNWLDWSLTETYAGLLRFVRTLAAFRASQPALRRGEFLTGNDTVGSGYPDVSWHGVQAWKPDWSLASRTIAFLLCGRHSKASGGTPDFIYAAFNMYYQPLDFEIPVLPKGLRWHKFLDTALPEPADICIPGQEPLIENPSTITLGDRSVAVLVGR